MKASELVKLLQQRITQYDDLEIKILVQTGADSFLKMPVTDVMLNIGPRNKRTFLIETD